MLYVALTFWLLVIVLTAWGVHQLGSGLIRAKLLNTLLLPGTLVAQVGHVLGLLVTGATISNTTLYKDDESGAPEQTRNPQPRIPVIGPVIIGLLPLVACATAIYFVAHYLGAPFTRKMSAQVVGPKLPTTLAGVWDLLRGLITLVESVVSAIAGADMESWRTWLFLYLLVCLAVRIAPFPGNLRGSLAAIVVLGIIGALVSSLTDVADTRVQNAWAVLNLTASMLLLLLFISLLVRGAVGLVRILRNDA
jgi:hypothetical protein